MSLPSPKLADLIDASAVQSLMDDFYDIAHIPMAIIDVEGQVLVGVGWQDVCTKFHRLHPVTCKACIESDTELSKGVEPGTHRLYKCKNHMWDVATPIVVHGRHVGNVFSGQFFFADEPIDYALFGEQARRYGFDEQEYLNALERVPRLTRAELDKGLAFFVKLAHMVSHLGDANMGLAQVVADRDELTESLRRSEADLARAQSVAHTGSWRLDMAQNSLTWSSEVYRLFEVPPGTPMTYETFLAAVYPDDRAAVDAAWKAALAGKPYEVEHRIVAGDAVKWVRETAELEFDENRTLTGGFGTVQDITRHKQAEANQLLLTDILALLNRGGDLRTLISDALRLIRERAGFAAIGLRLREGDDCPYYEQDGFPADFLAKENSLAVRDHAGRIVRDADGHATLECTCGLVLSGRIDPAMSCFTGGGSFWTNASHELLALAPEDDPRVNPRNRCIHCGYQSVALVPVRVGAEIIGVLQLNDHAGGRFTPDSIAFYESLAQNIGLALQRATLEGQLRDNVTRLAEANRLKDEFLSTLSHELRTPLNAILGWAHLLLTGRFDAGKVQQALEAIDRNARAQLNLVNDVLDVARVVSGKLRLQVQPIDIAHCLNGALDAVRPAAAARQITLESSIEGFPVLRGDPDRLQQVLWNLLSNAVKFTPAGGNVAVLVREVDGQVRIDVRDSGIGIAPAFMPHLFERFRQADGSTTRAHGGLGLGLAIVRHLVELHGGEVHAESEGEGRGTTFTVTLPASLDAHDSVTDGEPDHDSVLGPLAPPPASLNGIRVLVLDDESDARELLNAILSELGASVQVVATARDALQAVQEWRPAVIVSDIAMPEEDGYEFIRKVRELSADRGGRTPAVALTAYGEAKHRRMALEAGYLAHVAKPVSPSRLAQVIGTLASGPCPS